VTGDESAHSPAPSDQTRIIGDRNLALRVVSALVLAPVAIAVAYFGGAAFVVFWALAALGIQWEWRGIVGDTSPITLVMGVGAVVFVAVKTLNGDLNATVGFVEVVLIMIGSALAAGFVARNRPTWVAGGVLYSSILVLSVCLLRSDPRFGLWAILYLFAIVWATDILGYFVGRLVGGPKLSPRLSPKKTWSGAVGGALGAVLAGLAVTRYAGLSNLSAAIGLGLVLSAISQGGDLFESAVKRRFGAKDAGRVIPGHGGFMDRLDGFLAAAVAAAIIGLAHGGLDAPARGLLVW
jgi:phosphatidate cytidylyltransferase